MIHYPIDATIEQIFPPTHSNSSQYMAARTSLVRKLKKKGLLTAFDDQMVKSIKEGHAVMLSPEEGRKMLQYSSVTAFQALTTPQKWAPVLIRSD